MVPDIRRCSIGRFTTTESGGRGKCRLRSTTGATREPHDCDGRSARSGCGMGSTTLTEAAIRAIVSILSRGGAVWQLVGLITRRSKVQILPPQPDKSTACSTAGRFFCGVGYGEVDFKRLMQAHDFRPCPFCAHVDPIVVTIASELPAYVIACPECGATGPNQLPGVAVRVAIEPKRTRSTDSQRCYVFGGGGVTG